MDPTHLLCSSQKRALATAEFIFETTGLVPEVSSDLVEILRPEYLVGAKRNGWRMIIYMSLWYFGHRPASRHDGETYLELRNRIKKAKDRISTFPPDARVVVVSHAGFITFFLSHLNYEHALNIIKVLRALYMIFLMRNTQITHLTYEDQKWQIKSR